MQLNEDHLKHYSRNIKLDNFGVAGQEKLLSSSVLVAGAGGLGSPVIAYLAASGIGRIGIVDCDTLERSNLNRQVIHSIDYIGIEKVISARNFVNKLNPDVKIEIYPMEVDSGNIVGLISKYDLVLDCLDTLQLTFLLNDTCVNLNKPLVHAGVVGYTGQLMTVIPRQTACLRCIFPNLSEDLGPTSFEIGILGATAGTLGCLMSIEAIKYFLGMNLTSNKLLVFDSINATFKTLKVSKSANCKVCS